MAYPGALDLLALAKLNDVDLAGSDAASFRSRALDADGDGRPDLYLVDDDGDGSVDGIVRAVDSDGDGINDTFVQFNAEGEVDSIGRMDPATGELEVVDLEPDLIEPFLSSAGLADLEPPDEALFTSFDDPYILETYGSHGEDVPETWADEGPDVADDIRVSEMSEEEAAALETGTAGEEAGAVEKTPPEVVPRIVEIEDRSGGDGSSLWAKVDKDGDGLADTDAQLGRTSTGTYYGDIDQDGYSENVASDIDMDGRIDTVDTTGQGSSLDTVDADQIVEPGSGHLVDSGEADGADSAATADDDIDGEGPASSGGSDIGGGSAADTDDGYDPGADSGSASGGGDDPV